jgi:hypothetical protein
MTAVARSSSFRSVRALAGLFALSLVGLAVTPAAHAGAHTGAGAAPTSADIVDTAVAAGSFTTLVAAGCRPRGYAQSYKILSSRRPTPRLPGSRPLDNLRRNQNWASSTPPFRRLSPTSKGTVKPPRSGRDADHHHGASGVTVNGANVTKADIGASNGVITSSTPSSCRPRSDVGGSGSGGRANAPRPPSTTPPPPA